MSFQEMLPKMEEELKEATQNITEARKRRESIMDEMRQLDALLRLERDLWERVIITVGGTNKLTFKKKGELKLFLTDALEALK